MAIARQNHRSKTKKAEPMRVILTVAALLTAISSSMTYAQLDLAQ